MADVRTTSPGTVAAIDCGTNSTRLLVAGADGSTLTRLMRITRLGSGVDRTRSLAEEAIARTVQVLAEYRTVMDRHGVVRARLIATSAARDASNREQFFDAAEAVTGLRPELLDGTAEGRLSFAGATAALDPVGAPWLVADIGGGSTELAIGPSSTLPSDRSEPVAVRSLDVGCVRLTERFLKTDPPKSGELAAATAHVEELLAALDRQQPEFEGAATLVGLAGTVASLAALDQELAAYDRDRLHHFVLTRRAVEGLLAAMAAETVAERSARAGMETQRADVVVGGTIVLVALLRHFRIDSCLTSESDILDGLAMTLLR